MELKEGHFKDYDVDREVKVWSGCGNCVLGDWGVAVAVVITIQCVC
jgi:hypothetical protein